MTARPTGRGPGGPRLARGVAGEDRAASWYEAGGYHVLARNWRCRDGEIDLICSIDGCVVFCEVKTRSSAAFGLPAEAVTRPKQERLRRLAVQWLDSTGHRAREIRFDVAAVLGDDLEVIEDAF